MAVTPVVASGSKEPPPRVFTTTASKSPRLKPELIVPVKRTLPLLELGELELLIRKPLEELEASEVLLP